MAVCILAWPQGGVWLSGGPCPQSLPPPPAGIGYFTLPFLVHAGAAFVHACEWNSHAVEALHRTLLLNGVRDRCHIHAGDNWQVSAATWPRTPSLLASPHLLSPPSCSCRMWQTG